MTFWYSFCQYAVHLPTKLNGKTGNRIYTISYCPSRKLRMCCMLSWKRLFLFRRTSSWYGHTVIFLYVQSIWMELAIITYSRSFWYSRVKLATLRGAIAQYSTPHEKISLFGNHPSSPRTHCADEVIIEIYLLLVKNSDSPVYLAVADAHNSRQTS